jgi:beta-galactosidase
MNEPNMVFQYCSTDRSRKATDQRKRDFAEAHARAYDLIKRISKKPVGVIYANGDLQPLSPSDEEAVKLARYNIRFSFFDYIIRGDSQWLSTKDGGESGVPDIMDDMVGKTDWIGVNYYSRDMVRSNGAGWEIVPGYGHATGQQPLSLDGRSVSETGWEIYPEGIYNVVMEYQKRYSVQMMVTENGMADATDKFRPRYLVSHISQLERAIEDGANLKGYFHWALTDNFEWASGFSKKFGLFGVDLRTKQRQLRPSALIFSRLSENNGVPDNLRWMTEEKI